MGHRPLVMLMCLAIVSGQAMAQLVSEAEGARTALNQPAPVAPVAPTPPLHFQESLPTDAVAWIDGKAITADALLRIALKNHLPLVISEMVTIEKLRMELAHRGLKVDEAGIEEEFRKLMKQVGHGGPVRGVFSATHIRMRAWAQRGWKIVYWDRFNIPVAQRHLKPNPLFPRPMRKRIFKTRIRGQPRAPVLSTASLRLRMCPPVLM